MTWTIAIIGTLACIFGPHYLIIGAGYLIQKFKFGVPFKEVYAYHKEQDRLERESK